jgi:hypothetical protein
MGYTLRLDHPHFPEGTIFAVSGLPEMENGKSIGIDEDGERFFVANVGLSVEDAFANDPTVSVSGSSDLSADEVKQLIGDDRGTDEELGRAGGAVEEVATPPVQAFLTPPSPSKDDNAEGGDVDA